MPNTTDVAMSRRGSKWLWAIVAVPPIAALTTVLLAPEPHGHWSEHLSSAALKAAQLLVLLVLAAMVGPRQLRVLLVLVLAVVSIGIVLQVVGDIQVANSIWRTTGNPEFGIGYDEGHERSESGDLLVLAGGIVFAGAVAIRRGVPAWLAVVAVVMIVIPPPFLWPAAGILVVLLHALTSKARPDSDLSRPRSRPIAIPPDPEVHVPA